MLRHDSVQTTEQARGTLLPPSTLRLVYLLYELPNRPDGLPPSGTFTACYMSYRTGQTDFHPLALLRLAARATEQARRVSSGTFTACSIAKHRIGQTDSSTLWHLTALPFAISLGWVVTIDMDYIPLRSWPTFDLYVSLVWSADFIAALFQEGRYPTSSPDDWGSVSRSRITTLHSIRISNFLLFNNIKY